MRKEQSQLSKQLGLHEVTNTNEIVTLAKVIQNKEAEHEEININENNILADLQLIDQCLQIIKTNNLVNRRAMKHRRKTKIKDLIEKRINFELEENS